MQSFKTPLGRMVAQTNVSSKNDHNAWEWELESQHFGYLGPKASPLYRLFLKFHFIVRLGQSQS
jgi:hypothetical protein